MSAVKQEVAMIKRQIKAVEESIILWGELAATGSDSKYEAVTDLYANGDLPRELYLYNCPLCEYARRNRDASEISDNDCDDCPWPGTGPGRCLDEDTLFCAWEGEHSRDARYVLAGCIATMLEGRLFELREELDLVENY